MSSLPESLAGMRRTWNLAEGSIFVRSALVKIIEYLIR